ncbi:MAG TPA: SIMPL domain-containing protein [Methyloceanibacter sp.]
MTSTARKYLFSLLALLLASAPALSQVALADDKEPEKRTITISGKGLVKSAPDKVTVSAGVESQAPTAKDALAKNTAAMTSVIDALKSEGIDAKDIQTTNFSVSPRYEDHDDGKPARLVGYSVFNSVYVTMHDTAKLGGVLDQLVSAGSNSIGGISFGIDKPEALENEARKLAMADAIAKAKLYAEAAGAELGPVQTITEQGGYVPYSYPAAPRMEAAAAKQVPIEPGTQNVDIHVQVTWELK